jgi:hypothetical protein
MDATRFDSLSRSVGKSSSRRQAIKLLGGGAVGAVAAAAGLGGAGAKRKGKKHKGERRHAGAVSAQMMTSDGDPTGDVPTPVEPRPQNDFVRSCRANGGTSKSVGTYKVKCCYPPVPGCTGRCGWCDTCDFHSDPPSCKETMLLSNGVEIDADVTPGPAFP